MAGTVGIAGQPGPLGRQASRVLTFLPLDVASTVATSTGAFRLYNDSGEDLTLGTIRASVGTAPTGSTLIVDVKQNGTSIFATTTANRPTIAISGFTGVAGTPDTPTWTAGSYLTFDVLQIGSSVAGSNLRVSLTATPALPA